MTLHTKTTISRKAYAKINLGLDVVRRREDGYHEVKMIMQTVDLYDVLEFTKVEEPGITVRTDKEELPGDESNLVYQAARLVTDAYSIPQGISIFLKKNIPMAAGMAGGSTDAAAVFHGMNELFGLGMTEEEMCKLAVKIGADVPYCVQGGTALSEGIGEILTKLEDAPDMVLLIAKPDIDVSTKYVYEHLHANELKRHPDIDGMRDAVEAGDLGGIVKRMENVLETVTVKKYPVIEEIKEFMKANGALNALMSGSGPTVFGIYGTKEEAAAAFEALKRTTMVKQIFVTGIADRETAQNRKDGAGIYGQ